MQTEIRKEHILSGVLLAAFFLYIPFHNGEILYAIGTLLGCVVGSGLAVDKSRKRGEPLTRKRVWLNATICSLIATAVLCLLVGGPIAMAEGIGYTLVIGSATAWGSALIVTELLRNDVSINPPTSQPTASN